MSQISQITRGAGERENSGRGDFLHCRLYDSNPGRHPAINTVNPPQQSQSAFDLQGAKLSALSQAIAYRGIMERQPRNHRETTSGNLQSTREAIRNYNNILETDETLWSGIRRRTLRTRVRQFMYKAMHGTQKVGKYWQHLENAEQREFCTTCGVTESMEHILIRCQATPRSIIWRQAEDLWPHAPNLWPDITMGIILGCGAITLPIEEDPEDHSEPNQMVHRSEKQGSQRLLQILISEAAHLIWVLRCERVIPEPPRIHTENEIKTRWLNMINTRLTNDKIIATKIKCDERTTRLVKTTWEPTLKQSLDLPNDWLHHCEVLVGRNP